jgi:acetolactate synthase-1/2/3 large subunit
MGCGLPYAIGASVARNKGIVFCITGDGGLQMNIQELQVLARDNLPVKIFVLNNSVLGKISEVQKNLFGARYACTAADGGYTVPDFEKLASAYRIASATIHSAERLKQYKEWMLNDKPCLINMIIPNDSKLVPKIDWDSGEILPVLDDNVMKKVRNILRGEAVAE